jgi:hypothetical protein
MTKHTTLGSAKPGSVNRRNLLKATAGLTFALAIAPDKLSFVDEAFA